MSPPVPPEQQCGHLIRKHDGTGRTTTCVIRKGHKDARHRDAEHFENMRAKDTPERRQRYRSHRHGMPGTWYEEQLIKQEGKCAICRKTPEENGKRLAVDHDHACCPAKLKSCGRCVRGLLCDDCNRLLGNAHDNVGTLLAAVAYLS